MYINPEPKSYIINMNKKAWKLLKKPKKNRPHKKCNHHCTKTKGAMMVRAKPKENHLHSRCRHVRSWYSVDYRDHDTVVMLEWQAQHFIQTMSPPADLQPLLFLFVYHTCQMPTSTNRLTIGRAIIDLEPKTRTAEENLILLPKITRQLFIYLHS